MELARCPAGRVEGAWRPRRHIALVVTCVAAATLVGCASSPTSYLYDNQVYYRAVKDRDPLYVVAIDGSSPAFRPVPISPGEHVLTLEARSVGGLQPTTKKYPITIEACTRYYLAAQRATALSQDWDLVVERTFPAGGCGPVGATAKPRTTLGSAATAPASSTLASGPAPVGRTTR